MWRTLPEPSSAQKTPALPKRLQIEDPSAVEDATANIPASLIDVVEKISDAKYEITFPLTHLKPLQRIALGIGNSRTLLVRLIVGNPTKPSEFCIHFHPEQAVAIPPRSIFRRLRTSTSTHP